MLDVLDLRRDGIEQPQFYALTVRYANMGEGYKQTVVLGTESYLRGVLRDGEIAEPTIDELFRAAY